MVRWSWSPAPPAGSAGRPGWRSPSGARVVVAAPGRCPGGPGTGMPGGRRSSLGRAHRHDRRASRGRAGPACRRAVRSYRRLGQQRRCLPARPAGGDSARGLQEGAGDQFLRVRSWGPRGAVGAPAAWSPWQKRLPRAGSSGSTTAILTGCSSSPSQPPPTMATCTHPFPAAALRPAAAGGPARPASPAPPVGRGRTAGRRLTHIARIATRSGRT
jgi:hypothetical protein